MNPRDENQTRITKMKTTTETINGVKYEVSFNGNPISGLSPIRYRSTLRSEDYSGGNPEVDAALTIELARDAKITAGPQYKENPSVRAEFILDLRYKEESGGPDAAEVLPVNPEPTHVRYVMHRALSGDYVVATKKIGDIRMEKLGTAYLWTQE